MEFKTNSGLTRISLLRNQLASSFKKESINSQSTKNPLNKWRKKSNIDNNIIEDLYYPFHKDLKDEIYKIMKSNPEFK